MSVFSYGGRHANIRALGGEAINGFYCFAVDIDECTAEGEDVLGIEDSRKESVPLATLRSRADANQSSVAAEAQAVRDAAIGRAEEAFKNAVDAEALT
jgi:hypothetical protein